MEVMTQEREARILQGAIDKYGCPAQTIKAVEELAELSQALCKYLNYSEIGLLEESDLDAVLEEMADCYIMLNQLTLIYGDPTEWEIRKLERLEARLNG